MMEANVFWYKQKSPSFPRVLAGDVSADVVIVGGGMTGLSCAQALNQAGVSTALLEKDFCGAGASGRSSGFITPDSEIGLGSLSSDRGVEEARRVWEFALSGVEAIRKNIQQHAIECDYQIQDSLFVANSVGALRHVHEDHLAREQLGYRSRFYDSDQITRVIGTSRYAGAARYPDTFGMNSYLYCQALRDLLTARGVRIFEKSPATRIQAGGVQTAAGTVRARHVIVCADRFIPDLGALRKEIYHFQTFLGISKPLRDEHIHNIFPDGRMMVWDTDLIYHYFRVTGQNRVLLGGSDLRYTYARSLAADATHFAGQLTAYFRRKFPTLPIELETIWPGMLGISKDFLPVMGADPAHPTIWYTGAGAGLPWSAALGIYAADRVLKARNELDTIFSFRRKFVIGPRLQSLLTTPAAYAISHGIAEYF